MQQLTETPGVASARIMAPQDYAGLAEVVAVAESREKAHRCKARPAPARNPLDSARRSQ